MYVNGYRVVSDNVVVKQHEKSNKTKVSVDWHIEVDETPIGQAFFAWAEKNNLRLYYKTKGVSFCSKEDQYDAKLGEKIAYARCNEKIYNKVEDILDKFREYLHESYSNLCIAGIKMAQVANRENTWLNENNY